MFKVVDTNGEYHKVNASYYATSNDAGAQPVLVFYDESRLGKRTVRLYVLRNVVYWEEINDDVEA